MAQRRSDDSRVYRGNSTYGRRKPSNWDVCLNWEGAGGSGAWDKYNRVRNFAGNAQPRQCDSEQNRGRHSWTQYHGDSNTGSGAWQQRRSQGNGSGEWWGQQNWGGSNESPGAGTHHHVEDNDAGGGWYQQSGERRHGGGGWRRESEGNASSWDWHQQGGHGSEGSGAWHVCQNEGYSGWDQQGEDGQDWRNEEEGNACSGGLDLQDWGNAASERWHQSGSEDCFTGNGWPQHAREDMAAVTARRSHDDLPNAASIPWQQRDTHDSASSDSRHQIQDEATVPIDALTEVPLSVFCSLLTAANEACGQHERCGRRLRLNERSAQNRGNPASSGAHGEASERAELQPDADGPSASSAMATGDGAQSEIGEPGILQTDWVQYQLEDGSGFWWWREHDGCFFLESASGSWRKFRDPTSLRDYWWHEEQEVYFWVD